MSNLFVYVSFGLSIISNILHFIAPRTKTKVDDKAATVVDKAQEVLPAVAVLAPASTPAKSVEGFKTDPTRDHRS